MLENDLFDFTDYAFDVHCSCARCIDWGLKQVSIAGEHEVRPYQLKFEALITEDSLLDRNESNTIISLLRGRIFQA